VYEFTEDCATDGNTCIEGDLGGVAFAGCTGEADDVDAVDEDNVLPDEAVACKLEDTFFDAQPAEWTAFFTMKMSGIINDPDAEEPDFAFLVKIGATLKDEVYNLGDNYGMYMLDSLEMSDGSTTPAVIAVGVGNVTWPVSGKLVSLWAGQLFVDVETLMTWKTESDTAETGGAVDVEGSYQGIVFEVWLDYATNKYRMECVRGIGALNAEETAIEGGMFFCLDDNVEFAIGEQMKWMDYQKMLDQDADILALLNEDAEGNPIPEDSADYRADVCICYEIDGVTKMDCEAMLDEYGIGNEDPDEDTVVTDDVVTDDVVTDEVMTDEDEVLTD
jgi:hypothetical protein